LNKIFLDNGIKKIANNEGLEMVVLISTRYFKIDKIRNIIIRERI